MTYFEIRFFGQKGDCFRVDEFRRYEDAKERFDKDVIQSNEWHKLIEVEPLVGKAIAHQIQLVERNDAMTWLTEHNNWAAA